MASSESRSNESTVIFEDLFPSMVSRLGAEGFIEELCNGFKLLMDQHKGLITFESLKSNTSSLGLDFYQKSKSKGVLGIFENHGDDDDDDGDDMIRDMLKEGDLDGDGCLDMMEFCVLMFRLSPSLMDASRLCLQESTSSAN